MKYQVTVMDRAEREARIAQSLEASSATEDFYDFRGAKVALKVIRVPIDLPVYRMENFRAFSEQAEYIARERKVADYFRAGQENESVQQVQHAILAKLAAKGTVSVTPVIDVLQREGQRDTLLITHSGVVVNGNRRLAAMRELYESDKGQYAAFGYVNCKVLPPDATANDILEIEGTLQAKPETRLDYDWIGDAELLSAMLRVKGTPEAVAATLGRKPQEVKNALQALSEADMYLKDWVRAPGEYGRVADSGEQLFKDLPARLAGKPPALQEASRAIAWTLFENGPKLEGRLYNYNVTFGKRATDVLDRLAEELGIAFPSPTGGAEAEAGEGGFDFDIADAGGEANYQPVINALRDDARKEEAVDTLIDVCASVLESEKDQKSGNAALKAITSANAKLAEVDLSRAAPETYDAIGRQLASVIQRANDLQGRLARAREQVVEPTIQSGGGQ